MRDIPVGNGSLLVTFDDKYQIRDVYFPHVGQENHTEGFLFASAYGLTGIFRGFTRTIGSASLVICLKRS
jgi:GH15 family glucan-1,4-alpha-glucosidase